MLFETSQVCSLIKFVVFCKSFYSTLGTRGFFSRATRGFVGHRSIRLRPKAEDTSGEVFRGRHILRLSRNRKPRMKSLWHPGYFYISQSREACCKLWLLFNASVTSELSLVFIRSGCDHWRKSSDLSCCSDHVETSLKIPLKSILASSLQRLLRSLKGFFSILIPWISEALPAGYFGVCFGRGPKPREWLKSLLKQ